MHYKHLNGKERDIIANMLSARKSCAEIARVLGRNRSTISRERKRNGVRGFYRLYYSMHASERARLRRIGHPTEKMRNPKIRTYVVEKLKERWSPEEIAGRIKLDYPWDKKMRISYQTIYTWIEFQMYSLRNDYRQYLRCKRRRKKKGSYKKWPIAGRKGIQQRPESVDNYIFYGDWEGDTVCGGQFWGQANNRCYAKIKETMGFTILHLDYNRSKFPDIKRKYGEDVSIVVPANLGSTIIYSCSDSRSAIDIANEFELEGLDSYFIRMLKKNGEET